MTDGPFRTDTKDQRASDTGDAQVDELLTVLEDLADSPVPEHADVYLALHARLQDALDPDAQLRRAGAHGTA